MMRGNVTIETVHRHASESLGLSDGTVLVCKEKGLEVDNLLA